MSKILAITAEAIAIGTDDGAIVEVRPEDVTFDARVGDEVTLFSNEQRTLVTKSEPKNTSATGTAQQGSHVSKSGVRLFPYCLLTYIMPPLYKP